MLLPQLHEELTRAAAARHPVRRAGGITVGALGAAFAALLLAAPTAHARLADLAVSIATTHLRCVL